MTTIRADDSPIALINSFFFARERTDELLHGLTETTEGVMRRAAEIAERFDPMLYAVAYVDGNPEGA